MMHRFIKIPLLLVGTLFTSLVAEVPLTPTQLHAVLGVVTNFILDDGTVQFHGKTYKSVTSPHTGRVWLDRNIGANQKCTSFDDTACYGDYFQWGRGYDGHQNSIDSTTTLATNINNAGSLFVRGSADWASTDTGYGNARATNWLKTDGSSVCPVGYRVPLKSEIAAEVGSINSTATAFSNFLKLPSSGYRDYSTGNYSYVGAFGSLWSISSTFGGASYFRFYVGSSSWVNSGLRGYGLSLRCIKHVGKPLIYHNTTVYATVTSPYTGRVWLDRNLGASQVCTAFNDTACYGDYYQWGRNFDGHQNSTSATTATLATNVNAAGSSFITNNIAPADWTSVDATGARRMANWSKTDGSSVCPIGFRVPSLTEIKTETLDNGVTDSVTAFTNFLKLPLIGYRSYNDGHLGGLGVYGNVWTTSVNGFSSKDITFRSSDAYVGSNGARSDGLSVRCLKN